MYIYISKNIYIKYICHIYHIHHKRYYKKSDFLLKNNFFYLELLLVLNLSPLSV